MPQRTTTDTTLRHLAMLSAIPVGLPGKSTSQIVDGLRDKSPDFDVTRRTIQRSLEQLSRRFPITSETRGRTNYWYWIEPPLTDELVEEARRLFGTYDVNQVSQ